MNKITHLEFIVFFCFCRESLIRTAFQCLQLVVTDFLPTMPSTCLQIVVDVAGSFGLQNQELNISLTSIGLLVRTLLLNSLATIEHFCGCIDGPVPPLIQTKLPERT